MDQERGASEQPKHKHKIIAAIPCFNEQRCIGSVVVMTKKFVDCSFYYQGQPFLESKRDKNPAHL